jgi:glucose/mannose-6-phosphate isomerase
VSKPINISAERLKTLDSHDTLGATLELPAQIQRGFELGRAFARTHDLARPDAIDWYGLGGSAVAGDLLRGYGFFPPTTPLRIQVRRYPVPAIDPRLLSSYSGNTIETITAFQQVPAEHIWFTMSSGGQLEELSRKARVPHLKLPGGYMPRCAIGYGLGAVMSIIEEVHGFDGSRPLEIDWNLIAQDVESYREFNRENNPALEFAAKLIDRTPLVYALDAGFTGSIGMRFVAQLAENAKMWAHFAELPELAHNEVEGWPTLKNILPFPLIIFLGSWRSNAPISDPRPVMQEILDSLDIAHTTLDPDTLFETSKSRRLELGIRVTLFLDAVTVFLALLRAIDPYEIPILAQIKAAGARA